MNDIGADLQAAYEDGYKAGLNANQRTGHWIDTDEGFSPCECSECESVEFRKSKYCPNCGAKMESEEQA